MTSQPLVLVSGASGKTGSATALELLQKGVAVRALVHKHDERSDKLKKMGAQIEVSDFFDPKQWLSAMQGVNYAYFLPIIHPFMLQGAVAFAAAAREAKVEHIVQMTQWLSSPSHPSLHTRQLWLVERMFSELPGIGHTVINPGMFADNFLRFIDFASLLGIYPIVTGKSRCAPVSNEDIGRVAAAILADPKPHNGKIYRPTGPKLLSAAEMSQEIAAVLKKKVLPIEIPFWLFKKTARLQGANPFEINSFQYYVEDHKAGAFEFGGGVNSVIKDLTGKPAEDFATIATRYAKMQFAVPSIPNKMKAIWNFSRSPLIPTWNFDAFERKHFFPAQNEPLLALQDHKWRESHDEKPVWQ